MPSLRINLDVFHRINVNKTLQLNSLHYQVCVAIVLKKSLEPWSYFRDFRKSAKSKKFSKNNIASDRMKKSNSRDHNNENQQNFHVDQR